MCQRRKSDCCQADLVSVEGLSEILRKKVRKSYYGCEGEAICTCFCERCGRPVCVSCLA